MVKFQPACGYNSINEDARGRIVGIEVKASATVGSQDLKGLKALAEVAGDRFLRGVVLYTGRESIPYGSSLHALPVDALWRAGASSPPSNHR